MNQCGTRPLVCSRLNTCTNSCRITRFQLKGLAITFDVSRGPENKHPPAVGDTFDFVVKHESFAAFAKKLSVPVEEVQPAVYDEEIVFLEPTKLIEMGIGKKPGGVGYEKGVDKSSDEM